MFSFAIQASAQEADGAEEPDGRSVTDRSVASIATPPARPSNLQPTATGGSVQVTPDDYVIGEQDALAITVWKEKDISGNVVVRPDGKITVPLVGELKVTGMKPLQLQATLTEKLKPYVTVPQVSVAVTQINSRKVYLIGQAAKEGPFQINSSTTVLQIIAEAGGLKDFAKRKKIYILRQQGQTQAHLPFNYDNVIRGKNTEQNVVLEPGDTVVVP